MVRWVDLSAHGLALKVRKQDDLSWLVLEAQPGAGAVPADLAEQLGFEQRDGAFVRSGTKITLGEVRSVFPNATVREFEADELRVDATPEPEPAPALRWWESTLASRYSTIYLVGASRGRESLTLEPSDGGMLARLSIAGVRREREGSVADIEQWLCRDALLGMGDAFAGGALSMETARGRLRLVKGEDLLFATPAPSVSPVEPGHDGALVAAHLSLPAFLQRAQAAHDGAQWQVRLDGILLDLPPALSGRGPRTRPETVLAEAHEAQVRAIVEHKPYDCTALASLAQYPDLAYPGVMSRGRRAEINVMRLVAQTGIADKLMAGEEGYCRLVNEPYMDLVIERHPARDNQGKLYLTHYFDQNGDRVMDAEMVFNIQHGRLWLAETATMSVRGGELRSLDRYFANMFSKNLQQQGFGEAKVVWPDEGLRRPKDDEPAPGIGLN